MDPSKESQDHQPWTNYLVCTVLSFAFIVGVPGNSFVIWTICGMKQRPLTILLILNLAIADLLVLATLPIWIYSIANTWQFSFSACKALMYIIYCNMYASVFLIMMLSLERFIAVFSPFAFQRWKKKKKKKVIPLGILFMWVFSIALGAIVTQFWGTKNKDDSIECMPSRSTKEQSVVCLLVETLVGFLVPFSVIFICYMYIGRKIGKMTCPLKGQSSKLITSLVVTFALGWFPYHTFKLIGIISDLTKDSYAEKSKELWNISNRGIKIAGAVALINSCINPLLYAFVARNFQSSTRFAKLSKLFEQMSLAVRVENTRETSSPENSSNDLTLQEMGAK